jgi:dTDP-4-amino-4,6-dideoxygalactose transaminase
VKIVFNKPGLVGNEMKYIKEALEQNIWISGEGPFTAKCHRFLEERFRAKRALLTTSCTHALEMAFMLLDIQPEDEVILPTFTFVSTVNAFYIRGAKPVFTDIREDNLNMDETQIAPKITSRTRAVCPVHYGGVACEMDKILATAGQHGLYVVEDAAQGVNARYKGQYLGSLGHLGAYSFHETKSYYCGEGGALVINDERFIERAEIIRQKGTNRSKFMRGEIDKYTWVDIGSSYLPSDILAAFLYAQMEKMDEIAAARQKIYEYYHENLKDLEREGLIRLGSFSAEKVPSYHMFYVIFESEEKCEAVRQGLRAAGINATAHYVPLHLSPMGERLGYKKGDFPVAEKTYNRLLRLPFHTFLTEAEQAEVVRTLRALVRS